MKRAEINNEVVSLRQTVRQARICVINKLIREAKRLRTSQGNDKQVERNKNRSDKLLREVFALKRIKDDEISKFGILNFENLQSVIQNPQTDDGTRAMAKVVRYKSLSSRIEEFTEKYPDYREYISWRKKKRSGKKEKDIASSIQEERSKRSCADSNGIREIASKKGKKNTGKAVSTAGYEKDENTAETQDKLAEPTRNVESGKDVQALDKVVQEMGEQQSSGRQNFKADAKVIGSQAAVKRFTEILQETEFQEQNERSKSTEDEQRSRDRSEGAKEGDDFFLHTGDTDPCSNVTVLSKNITASIASSATRETSPSPSYGRASYRKTRLRPEGTNKDKRYRGKGNLNDRSVFQGGKKEESKKYGKEGEKAGSGRNVKTETNESLHPSWVAKKKQQDIMKQAFQGKKIKFDVD